MSFRREWLTRTAAMLPAWRAVSAVAASAASNPALADEWAAIERRVGGRLGVAIQATGRGATVTHRADERFPMCSTFKLLAVANVLTRVDAGAEHLDRFVRYGEADLLEYAPVTRAHVGDGGMTLGALCEAAITSSDNTAGHLLLDALGGPEGLTRYARTLGDRVTRLDRNEPELNRWEPGDLRDTTSPAAMLADVRALLVETTRLTDASRTRLGGWMVANTTGAGKLRAGVPPTWRIGDKTGSGGHNATNDVAIAWPPGRPPVLIVVYSVDSMADVDARNAAIADVGRLAASL